MRFAIRSTEQDVDLLDAVERLRRLERSHKLAVDGSNVLPTAAFLRDVARYLADQGFDGVTLAAAWQFWLACDLVESAAAAKLRTHSRIAYWYGIDPRDMTERERIGYLANLRAVQAEQTLHRRDYDPTDHREVYRLFRLAYDDEELAREQQAAAFALYVERCTRRGQR